MKSKQRDAQNQRIERITGNHLVIGMAILNLVKNNTEFSAQHPYNTKVKKMKKIHSIIKLCGKLARILVAMTNQDQSYIPEKFTVMPLAV